MSGKPNNIFWWVFGAHAGAIFLALIIPLIQGWIHPRPQEIVQFVEFVSEPGTAAESPILVTAPPPVKQPVVEAPKPEPAPAPEKPKWKPAKVIRQNKRVTPRPVKTQPTQKRISASDIQKALGAAGTVSPFAAYYNTVKQRMYGVWQVPVAAPIGLSAQGVITIGADGAVSNRRLLRPSGNAAFDQSIQKALNTVQRLPAPPANLPSRTITIEFAPQ